VALGILDDEAFSMNLILVDRSEVAPDGTVRLADARARHVRMVLKAPPGHEVRVGILDGPRGIGTVTTVDDEHVALRCVFERVGPPRPQVDLLLALPRPKVMRRLWAQLAALGVGQIILTNAERVERDYFDTHILDEGTYRPLLIEGLQQARDTHVPAVSIHRRFRNLVEDDLSTLFPEGLRVVAHPGVTTSASSIISPHANARVLLAVGPEGGWNDFELSLLSAHGFQSIGLGPRSLRSDTACVALVAVVSEILGGG
jgi:16S rRNA (uracil1498-N3)-methyltransferase